MKHSISYYIILLVLRIKGIKKTFSKDPIDYKKVRKEDVPLPKPWFFKGLFLRSFTILNSTIHEIKKDSSKKELIIFIHGGAFISGPAIHHWHASRTLVSRTNYTLWMCNYPKAPEVDIIELSKNIDEVYNRALLEYDANKIVLIGDSVGGTIITSLIQRINSKNLLTPKKVILISPVMDASMSNHEIDKVDKLDPMLSKSGVLSSKKMIAGKIKLIDPRLSPLYGSFDNFPPTLFFAAEHDITFPDQCLAISKMKNAGVALNVIHGEDMPHIWPLLPVMKESKKAFDIIINFVK